MVDRNDFNAASRALVRIGDAEAGATVEGVPPFNNVGSTDVREAWYRAEGGESLGKTVLTIRASNGVHGLTSIVVRWIVLELNGPDSGNESEDGGNNDRGKLHDGFSEWWRRRKAGFCW